MAESVANLVERLELAAKSAESHASVMKYKRDAQRERQYAKDIREAASRLAEGTRDPLHEFCQSEGPRGETICMLPLGHEGECGWERREPIVSARLRAVRETIDSLQDGGWLKPEDADHIRATLPSTPPASPAATTQRDPLAEFCQSEGPQIEAERVSRIEVAASMLQEVIDKSEPRKPGGQQVGVQRYQMTPSTRQELQRILRHWKDARISAAERPAPTCQWTEDDDGVWHTDCGEAWQFTTDGPIENRQRYCGYCGKSLSAAPRSVVAPEE